MPALELPHWLIILGAALIATGLRGLELVETNK